MKFRNNQNMTSEMYNIVGYKEAAKKTTLTQATFESSYCILESQILSMVWSCTYDTVNVAAGYIFVTRYILPNILFKDSFTQP